MKDIVTLEDASEQFSGALIARNLSAHTITAYKTDIRQFITWVHENTLITRPDQVTKADMTEYLTYLSGKSYTGVTRARKLASLRTFFQNLVESDLLSASPASNINMPKKERKQMTYLRPDEYSRMLAAAGTSPRDYAVLQLFLQTGIRVNELVGLHTGDIDLIGRTMRIMGKGQKERVIDLEKKAAGALKVYLATRPQTISDHVFLNYKGDPISDRGIKKIVEKYRRLGGITKKISCHSLRHTFATYKAERGVSAFQLREWLGHASMDTSLLYVHLGKTEAAKKAMEATSL